MKPLLCTAVVWTYVMHWLDHVHQTAAWLVLLGVFSTTADVMLLGWKQHACRVLATPHGA
jgi:hypothetical protein